MTNPPFQAETLFAGCFTKEELEFLRRKPEFIEATRSMETLNEAMKAVELGELLIRQTWQEETGFSSQ